MLQDKSLIQKPKDTPVINGYRILKDDDAPLINANYTIMTWGEIKGKPKFIGELSKTTYNFPTKDKREDISIDMHRMSRKKIYENERQKYKHN